MNRLRYGLFFLLLCLFLPPQAQGQTRFYPRGDSGITLSLEDSSGRTLAASYTHRGWLDLGIGAADDYTANTLLPDFDEQTNTLIFGNLVILGHRADKPWGVELQGRYLFHTYPVDWPAPRFGPSATELQYQSLQSGVRGYTHIPISSSVGMIVGLGGFYRFAKSRRLSETGEVLRGYDQGKWGMGLDLEFRFAKVLSTYLKIRNVQTDSYNTQDQWDIEGTLGLGLLLGIKPATAETP